jgi:nucleoside-diphosphate-sugar epimerase
LIDNKKAEKLLGFKPKIDIKEGIRKTVEWYRTYNSVARL